MLCGIPPPQHHHHRLLRSFRSHKGLSQEAANMHFRHHHTKESDLSSSADTRSSMESSTSSRPSTSGGKSDLSVDWDPLRLHPPLANAPVPQLPEDDNVRRYQPYELRQSRSMHNIRSGQQHHQQPQRQHHHQPSTSTVIYGGFDFGFSSQHQRPTADRCSSPTPSTASDASSLYGVREAEEWGDNGVITPLPAPRRSRPQPPAGIDEAENFIRRGGWKRRGIVFVTDSTAMATEDETWEI
ncbi:hypothetical protein QBC38DRAFT_472089 [Podospora fimiseda]|uniref:Uncharacterized protein n=1 Tax=Podospora fimiseda TaxID=252190 RepID=A0AAN7BU76_9PEZI|nr:hypothetical protein QBC38DRAFT_472089 [Podospora fimiseda]